MTSRAALRNAAHIVAGSVVLVLVLVVACPAGRVRSAMRRRRGALPRILWAPTPIINIRYSAAADRLYGYESDTLVYDVYGINKASDFTYSLDVTGRSAPLRLTLPYFVLGWSLFRYDLYGFFFDGGLLSRTPLWMLELPLLKLAGKRIVAYPYGSDGRVASEARKLGRWNAYTDIPTGAEDRDEADVRRRIHAVARWADAMLGCADLVEHLPRVDGVFPYVLDTKGWEPKPEIDDGVVTIAHSPNHRHFKGTRFLIDAVEQLRAEGAPIELTLVERVPNAEAKRIYASADVIADQFLIGAYALFAIEGMALGKPVVCYLNSYFEPWHPEWAECPIVSANPDELLEALRTLAADVELRREAGRRGVEFVEKYHSLEAVGGLMDGIYRRVWFGAETQS